MPSECLILLPWSSGALPSSWHQPRATVVRKVQRLRRGLSTRVLHDKLFLPFQSVRLCLQHDSAISKMPDMNGVHRLNNYVPPPSSILATCVANGDTSNDFNQDRFNQLLEESLGSDENGVPNLGSDASVNHKLICIVVKAGVDPFIQNARDNPFQSNGASSRSSAEFVCCLDVVRTAIERSPVIIFVKSVPEDQSSSYVEVPLFVWILPKLLPLLKFNDPSSVSDAVLKVFKAAMVADEDPLKGSQAGVVVDFILNCSTVLLNGVWSSKADDLNTKISFEDEPFTSHMWRLQLYCDGIARRLSFENVGALLDSLTYLLRALKPSAQCQAKKLQVRKQLLRLQEISEDMSAGMSTSTHSEVRRHSVCNITTNLKKTVLAGVLRMNLEGSKNIKPEILDEASWPDSGRARKRARLSDIADEQPRADSIEHQLSRNLTAALCGIPAADLDGLSRTAPSTFRKLSELQQSRALLLLGSTTCQLCSGSSIANQCLTCDNGDLTQRITCAALPELLKTLISIASSIPRNSRARVVAMTVLRRLLLHSSSPDILKLGPSAAGEWCLQSLRSSSRDLRLAAIETLQVFILGTAADSALAKENRIVVLDFLQALWLRSEPAFQETAILALTRMALLVGDEELNIIILRLIECLGHSNPYISGLASEEIQELAQTRQMTVPVLFRPFWRTIGPLVAKQLSSRSLVVDNLCTLMGMQASGLMLLIEEYSLPHLVANQNHTVIQDFATAHGGSTTAFDICTNPRNLPAILSHLLCQGYQDPEQKIMDLLGKASDEFFAEDLPQWLAHSPIEIACSLLKSIGDHGEGRASRTYQALQLLAQLLYRKPGHHLPSSKRSETISVFLEANVLAIVTHFTVLLNDLEAKEPKLEKKRCIAALGELVKLGKSRVIVALPQLCACLRSALDDPDLCDTAFHSWGMVVSSLNEDDVTPLIDQTLAIIAKSWDSFSSSTQQYAYDLISMLLKRHADVVRECFETMPSLESIPSMSRFETEISSLKNQMDDRHQLMAFVTRVADENETVAERALLELVPVLRAKQDMLHRSIMQEQPDGFVPELMRSLLDCCVRFQANPKIVGLCGQSLGSIGCLDHNKIETTRERKTILVLSNFGKAEETVDFMIFFLENVLVKAFLSAPTTRAQGFLAWAMQELLQLCEEEDRSGPRIRTGPSAAHRRWGDLPESVKSVLSPFLTSKYRVQDARPPEKQQYPYFSPGTRHKDWLRAVVLDFLHRAPGNNVELIFGICCRIVQGQDISIPAFLLPYAVLNLMVSGVAEDCNDVLKEMLNILQQSLHQQERKVQEDIKLCSQSVFDVLDYVQRWLQQRRKQYSSHLSRNDRSVSDLALESAAAEIKAVENMLEQIPPDVLSQRAIECKSYARALFHWEQYMRKSTSRVTRDQDLARLQEIYAQIDEPDGIEGISAQMNIVSIEGRVLEHKKAGSWLAAQSWYQMELSEKPDDLDLQRNLMQCLSESGQYDLLLDRFAVLQSSGKTMMDRLTPYAIEAAWSTSRWPELSHFVSAHAAQDYPSQLGQVLLALHQDRGAEAEMLLDGLYRSTSAELTPNAISSLQNCHDTLLRLQVLDDIRILSSVELSNKVRKIATLEKRLDILGSNVHDKQYLLGLRRAVMQANKSFTARDVASTWLTTARLARKARASNRAFDAVLKASTLGERSAALEEAKLIWQEGQHRKAIQALEGAIESRAFVAHDDFAENGSAALTAEQQNNQNEIMAKAYVLLGKWLDHAGQTQSEIVISTFKKATENYHKWEKGWYYLGRHYNKLLDSERTMPVEKQSEAFLKGELSRLVIKNFVRSLPYGGKYVFQTLPKVLTLWFELVDKPVSKDDRRTEQFQASLVAGRKTIVQDTNAYIKRYIDSIQPSILYTTLPQVVARICHADKTVYEILTSIIVKVVRTFPQQALWTLLAVMKSQSNDRRRRGAAIAEKVIEAQKKAEKAIEDHNKKVKDKDEDQKKPRLELTSSELRNMITAGQRFVDEVLRISEFPIEGKISRVSLARDLGFNHKIAPSRLVVPAETCLIPSIPTSHDPTYQKSFRAFPKDPVTITAFLDEALVLASLQKPRKLSIRGSDGNIYGVLAKPKDDMRKDQRLMEFNTMINRFLKRDVEASKRRLSIRTYAVIPLNEECGLIEWVNNLKTFRDIIVKLYKDKSITPNYSEIRNLLDEACSGNLEKISIFNTKVLKSFPPVFHEWFIESFPNPSAWFNARLRYTRSCAVMSFVGHVLGLGDRHGENILFEEDNGSLMHVDFNCLFDKGLTFEKPEHVPFRLTHNLVDAMGIYNYEGPFRRCSEITLTLLRNNEDALMTILETFLHDPTTDFIEKADRRKKKSIPNSPAEVLEGVRAKVRGFLAGESVPLSVEGYVQVMIGRSVDERNLGRMYIGWCAFF